MDGLHFDAYTTYSDNSAPRTPSPNQPIMNFPLKQVIEDHSVRLFNDTHNPHHHNHHDDNAVVVQPEYAWSQHQQPPPSSAPFQFTHSNTSRGSLLQELYDQDVQQITPEFPPQEPQYVQNQDNWQQQQARQHEFPMMRRATFPYVRQDRDDGLPLQPPVPQFYPSQQQQHHHQQQQQHQMYPIRQQSLYSETLPLSEPQLMNNSPHAGFRDFDDGNIKLEEGGSLMNPSSSYYHQPPPPANPQQGPGYPMSMTYLSPHTGLPVQHTDDAASKETQYLRRRCFNCHTTEPPSWRRSTLNPGKIVCNKCGLYERTHLRPRPLRFDELRAGNKARKAGKRTLSPKSRTNGVAATNSPPATGPVKKEPREFGLVRRSSVSSSSSVHSGSGASDWDDSVSVYSSGSAPPTSFNSPNVSPFPLSRDESSSPPQSNLALSNGASNGNGGIRLPNAPLSDIASMGTPGSVTQSPQLHGSPAPLPPSTPGSVPHTPNLPTHPLSGVNSAHPSPRTQPTPRKSHTSPDVYFSPSVNAQQQQQEDYFLMRRNSAQGSPAVQPQELLSSPATVPTALSA
ncbi:hypothetical protein CC1G_01461 [Coprinopsis cinerea okayama7|uniref:GATA-type domain-containing protein n=1 Tax=Coprinopsis cinerea (strain Okayama-7 / 130 / ATCC MYA-4618 / FGSC 9003) TaxID=240176 RepID=A8NYX3_COPC7|nr:hypothetical protein CC1G_01461 [Coprinopsis cinerea okayama7\|eukprot:XP_001837549.1 hypothetical protein CC1G_01461 [Coprinopsis cinerea okayama7\